MARESQTQQTVRKFPGVKWLVELLLFASSPLALLLLVLLLGALTNGVISHRRFVSELETLGRTACGEVDSVWVDWDADGARVNFVWQDADGEARWGHLNKEGHPPETWASLTPGEVVEIRYLPYRARYSDLVVLEAAYPRVRDHRPDHSIELILLGVTLIWLALKPQILYVGYVNSDRLLQDGVSAP